MPNAYDNEISAQAFTQFLESSSGTVQKQLLLERIRSYLKDPHAHILDAACGNGWLAGALNQEFKNIQAFDSSAALIERARKHYPNIEFSLVDAAGFLPYPVESFDVVILNMAAHDLHDLNAAFKNFSSILKPGGKFIMTIANPYYSFPVGVWKRGILGLLLRKNPVLKLRPYNRFRKQNEILHNWRGRLSSYFYPLEDHINTALQVGFQLQQFEDLQLLKDSPKFDAQYQLYRFPMILLLAFEKRSE